MIALEISAVPTADQIDQFDSDYEASQYICTNVIYSGDSDNIEKMFGWLIKPAALHNMLFPEDFEGDCDDDDDEDNRVELLSSKDKELRRMTIQKLVRFFESEAAAYRSLLE